ncbi:inositol monophosphatase [Planotetraspora thailandica]|uniref:Inositol monophosphatase n=1 Tax=Planotetraspora thailandica TaxID=487172 RepID=A0A8J3UZK7_9ACTN|nr:inositol monophosphatase family protein [Planotetraspora thailandica]GII54053.1 inositol monophosphatase [Planotetraspora thailandica]
MDLEHARRLAVEAANDAGTILREGTAGAVGILPKGSGGDVVTALDLAAEKLLIDRIQAEYPAHKIIAEESGVHGAGDWTWLIDPLDGTNNVAIGLPAYVVGLALCEGGRPMLGVVHDPIRRLTWSAIDGRGALGPGGPMPLPPPRDLTNGPVLAWTQGYGVARDDPAVRSIKMTMDVRARRVLQLWAPLLSWAMLARGDIDGMVGYHAEAVDLPAGALIAREAGLEIRDLDGGPFEVSLDCRPDGRSFVAGRPEMVESLLTLIGDARASAAGLPAL